MPRSQRQKSLPLSQGAYFDSAWSDEPPTVSRITASKTCTQDKNRSNPKLTIDVSIIEASANLKVKEKTRSTWLCKKRGDFTGLRSLVVNSLKFPRTGDNPSTRVVSIRKLRWTDRRGAFRSSCGAVRVVRRDDPWVPSAPGVSNGGGMQLIEEDGFVLSRSFAVACGWSSPTWSR